MTTAPVAAGGKFETGGVIRGGLRDVVEAARHFVSALALWWAVGKG